MKNKLEYYAREHLINQFIAVTSNEVVTVKAIEMYDSELDDYVEMKDPELISAYCYYRLNVFDDYSLDELEEFVSNKNKNWEIESVICA